MLSKVKKERDYAIEVEAPIYGNNTEIEKIIEEKIEKDRSFRTKQVEEEPPKIHLHTGTYKYCEESLIDRHLRVF